MNILYTVEKALNSSFSDFEDALQYFSATASNCDIIITRNAKDFRQSLLPIMSADEFLKSLNKKIAINIQLAFEVDLRLRKVFPNYHIV